MDLVVGTYDEVILGFRVVQVGTEFQVEASFTDHSHAGCVKCVAISSKGVLASGSSDETIRLLNIRKQKELGSLVHHNGTVTSLEFHKGFLFSTSEDKNLCLWKTFSWECLRTFKGHKAAADCVSVHPSGKLALTVGRDRALHTWNLITGRSAYITNLKQVASIVRWSPDGENYAIVLGNNVNIYSVENAEVILTVKSDTSINSLVFFNNDVCCYGGEGGNVIFYDIKEDKQLHQCETGTNRVKCFCISTHNFKDVSEKRILSTVSSDGFIKLYKVIENQSKITTELLIEHSTGFRITCLAVLGNTDDRKSHNVAVKQEKTVSKKNVEDNNNDDDDDDNDSDNSENSDTNETSKLSQAKQHTGKKGKPSVKVHKNETDLKSGNRKRKLNESSEDKKMIQAKTVNKQQKVGKQQKVDRHDGTVSFVTAADNKKKKFKKKKKKPKKTA